MTTYRIDSEHSITDDANIVGLLRHPRLFIDTAQDYPGHADWLAKVEAQLNDDKKHVMAAYQGGVAIGAVLYQQLVSDPHGVEIKNISVAPDRTGLHLASFLLRGAEHEARQYTFSGIEKYVVDTKETNTGMIALLEREGYTIEDVTDLYGLGAGLDVVMTKPAAPVTRLGSSLIL